MNTLLVCGSKVIYVSKRFAAQREAMEAKINTPEGKLLRVNRSIQAEGAFALTKQDLDYRRFPCRGTPKASAEWWSGILARRAVDTANPP